MILLAATTDKLEVVSSSAATLDVHASYTEVASDGSGNVSSGRKNTAISSTASADISGSPAASSTRNINTINVRNKDGAVSADVLVRFNQNGTNYELHKTTLLPGEVLSYIEGIGWFRYTQALILPYNYSTTDQAIGASVTNYLTGSNLTIGTRAAIGTILRWRVALSKTAAAQALLTLDVRFGTAGTTADTSRLSFALPTQSASADNGLIDVTVTVRGPISAACIVQGNAFFGHHLISGGLISGKSTASVDVTSGAFDITTAGLIAGLSLTTGASHAITISQVVAEAKNLS